MKKFALVAAIAVICTTAAQSADLPRAYTKANPMAPVANWTGFYAGLNVGYGFNDPSVIFTNNDPASTALFSPGGAQSIPPLSYNTKGVLGGAQIGYNWQFSPSFLLGLEADFQGADIKGSASSPFVAPGAIPFQVGVQQNVEWFGTVRGRAGWLATDKLLVFGTGGFAYGSVKDTVSISSGVLLTTTSGGFQVNCAVAVNTPCVIGNESKIQTGYTAGGGFEYAVWQNVTFKAEYLYVNLGSSDRVATSIPGPPNLPASVTAHFSDLDFHVARAGMNWRF